MEVINVCVVCEQGWILKGKVVDSGQDVMRLEDASVVRCWNGDVGIGAIAKAENKDIFTLDYIGDVRIRIGKILFEIPCEW